MGGTASRLSLRNGPGFDPVISYPLIMGLLRSRPLKAQPVAVRIAERQLLHAVRRDFRLLQIHAMRTEMLVSGIEIAATEKQRGIAVGRDASRIRPGRTLVGFICGI